MSPPTKTFHSHFHKTRAAVDPDPEVGSGSSFQNGSCRAQVIIQGRIGTRAYGPRSNIPVKKTKLNFNIYVKRLIIFIEAKLPYERIFPLLTHSKSHNFADNCQGVLVNASYKKGGQIHPSPLHQIRLRQFFFLNYSNNVDHF